MLKPQWTCVRCVDACFLVEMPSFRAKTQDWALVVDTVVDDGECDSANVLREAIGRWTRRMVEEHAETSELLFAAVVSLLVRIRRLSYGCSCDHCEATQRRMEAARAQRRLARFRGGSTCCCLCVGKFRPSTQCNHLVGVRCEAL